MKRKGATRSEIAAARSDEALEALRVKYDYSIGWKIIIKQKRQKYNR